MKCAVIRAEGEGEKVEEVEEVEEVTPLPAAALAMAGGAAIAILAAMTYAGRRK